MQQDGTVAKVCAIVVTYHPELPILESVLDAVASQVSAVVIVDNGSDRETVGWLSERACQGGVHVLPLEQNLGLGAAHNRGIEWARSGGYRYVLILDQDSIPSTGMVERLVRASQQLRGTSHRVAAVGPRYLDPVSGRTSFFVRFGRLSFRRLWCGGDSPDQVVETDFLISSGLLASVDALDEIGPMDETLFIDHVDTEWFLRARTKGFKAFGVCDAVMTHKLGSDTISVWAGRWRSVAVRSPLRHYYAVRNSFLLYRRQYAPGNWILNDAVRLLQMFCFYSLFTPPRLQQAGMMLKGAWHGIRGRSGRYR
jgi:rhamnosyltransferase